MTMETLVREDVMEGGMAAAGDGRSIQWSSIFAGALAAGAMSFILIGFGVAIGLGVSSASPTWRDARAEAGRILMTSSSHSGLGNDDRTYLVQQVATLTGLAAPDAERRVDTAIADSKAAIDRARRNSIIVAFSVAVATLIGAAVAWAAAVAGGRHRDRQPLPDWMASSNRFHRFPRAMRVP